MAVLKIRIWPDPALKEVAKPVDEVTDETRTIIENLFDTMNEASGVGLAATQCAIPQRILVIDLDPSRSASHDEDVKEELEEWGFTGAVAFVNPQIVESEGDIYWKEGCLSVPGINEKVKRREFVRVKALDKNGEPFEVKATGLFAVAIQHELDHLDGKVFVEYLSRLKRDVVKRKMVRLKTNHTDDGVEAALDLAEAG